jgi:hypothetical protein
VIDRFRGADVYVAHNCEFESSFFAAQGIELGPWICSYKCALRVWPELDGHSNQELRYARDLRYVRFTPKSRLAGCTPTRSQMCHVLPAVMAHSLKRSGRAVSRRRTGMAETTASARRNHGSHQFSMGVLQHSPRQRTSVRRGGGWNLFRFGRSSACPLWGLRPYLHHRA